MTPDSCRKLASSSQGSALEWLPALRRYLAVTATGHLAWEVAHVRLYGIWEQDSESQIAFAVLHCTAGDLLIALAVLCAALILVGSHSWPAERFGVVAVLTVAFGIGYTIYSEWLNVSVRGTWSYLARMPTLPLLGTGLSPLLQWLVVPTIALAAARVREPARPKADDSTLTSARK